MPSVFTKILNGEMPGRFVWKDDVAFAILSIAPLRSGHVLVIPRKEVEHWIDLDHRTMAHLTRVARTIGKAQMRVFKPTKIGMVIVGLEVRHVHLHVVPIERVGDLDFAHQDPHATAVDLESAAERIREALRAMGVAEVAG